MTTGFRYRIVETVVVWRAVVDFAKAVIEMEGEADRARDNGRLRLLRLLSCWFVYIYVQLFM